MSGSPTPQQGVVARAWAIFDSVEAPRPAAGLLMRWLRDVLGGDVEKFLRELDELALSGALAKGHGYVYRALLGGRRRELEAAQERAAAEARRPRPGILDIHRRVVCVEESDGTLDWRPVAAGDTDPKSGEIYNGARWVAPGSETLQ